MLDPVSAARATARPRADGDDQLLPDKATAAVCPDRDPYRGRALLAAEYLRSSWLVKGGACAIASATPEAPLSRRGGREKDGQRGGLDRTHVDRMTRPRLPSGSSAEGWVVVGTARAGRPRDGRRSRGGRAGWRGARLRGALDLRRESIRRARVGSESGEDMRPVVGSDRRDAGIVQRIGQPDCVGGRH